MSHHTYDNSDEPSGADSDAERDLIARARAQLPRAQVGRQRSPGTQTSPDHCDRPRDREAISPDSFAGYRIVGEIHRGGQGVVFQAVHSATQRHVAIKVMKDGPLASPTERARFEREIHILGRLRHPHVVAIHDSGVTAAGHYFVMDYVAGEALDEHVARARPGVRGTLLLVEHTCAAINAAHVRGIIHRDLKPGNIRVDSNGEPRVLDFGLAKTLTDDSGAPATVHTISGQFIGSVPWAAPEQALGTPDRIDVRTDVYSLGVILYRLLTGRFPHDTDGPLRQVLDAIAHAAPVRPRAITRTIDDEVETIILKCLAKEPERRYQNAGEIAADIHCYLAGEPISAKRDSSAYVLRKLVGRHRLVVTLAGTIAALLLGCGAWMSVLYSRAESARLGQAVEARNAIREANKAQAINVFLNEMLAAANRGDHQGREITVREALDAAVEQLNDGALVDQPGVEAAVQMTIGIAYRGLGKYEPAGVSLERARKLLKDADPPNELDLAKALGELGVVRYYQSDLETAARLVREAHAIRRHELGEEHDDAVICLNNLAMILAEQGDYEGAEATQREVLTLRRRTLGDDHDNTLASFINLGLTLWRLGRLDEAEHLFREALTFFRQRGVDHPFYANCLHNLSLVLYGRNQHDASAGFCQEAYDMRRRLYGDDHPDVANSLQGIARLAQASGDLDAAEQAYRQVLDSRRRMLGPQHPSVATTLRTLATLLSDREDFEEAERVHREALEIRRAAFGNEHLDVATSLCDLGGVLRRAQRMAEAESILREGLEIGLEVVPQDHPMVRHARVELGALLLDLQRCNEAETLLLAAHRAGAEPHREVLLGLIDYSEQCGRPDEAKAYRDLLRDQ